MYSILFVCTGNQFRSPIAAEIFLQQLIRDGRSAQWLVNSAGTWTHTGRPAPAEALNLARMAGVGLEHHVTRMLDQSMVEEADIIVVMESGHKEAIQVEFPLARRKVFLLSEVADGISYDVPDPAAFRNDAKQIIRDLTDMVRKSAPRIYQMVERQPS